jgi:uncharacterized protein DUF4337
MPSELEELEEHAEHGKKHPDLAPVTLTMAIIAVLVATVSLLGHRSGTEEVILQNRVTDQWSYYQAKNIRQHVDDQFADLVGVVPAKDTEAAAKVQEKYRVEIERYKEEMKELESKAHELEQDFLRTHRKTDRFDLGEVFLEIGLVVTSITLLSGRRIYWHVGLLFASAGIVTAFSALLIR